MPTIRDVAKLAGVAPITVSRVINNTSYVSEKTRERVEAAIEELAYIPNMLGPSLHFKRTMTLAVVVADITNPFWTTIIRGIEDIAQANGYSTILCNTDESVEKQEHYIHMLLRRRIDGILLVPASSSPSPIKLIQRQDIPVVILGRRLTGVDVDIVRTDSIVASYQLVRHLLSLGHRRIAVLTGPQRVSVAVDRVSGYLQAMQDAGIAEDETQVYWGSFTQDSGYEMMQQMLSSESLPTALFATNNFLAIGVMEALQERNLRVPDDFALVTFDDFAPIMRITPFLTAAIQPAREMGQHAAQLLLDRLKNESDDAPQHIVLPTELIIRASSGGPIAG